MGILEKEEIWGTEWQSVSPVIDDFVLSVVEYEHLRGTMSGLGGEHSTFQLGALFGIANLMPCEIKTLNKRMTTSRQDPTEMETSQSM